MVPPGRHSLLLSGLLLLVCVGGLAGLRHAGDVTGVAPARLAVVAGIGFALAALPAVPGGLAAMKAVAISVPGAGLLRDSQKWVALVVLVEAAGLGALVRQLQVRWRRYGGHADWWLLGGAVLVPLAVLPGMAWGLAGRLQPVSYPHDWAAVSSLLGRYECDGRPGDVAVLPWSTYREYAWNGDRPVLDPAPRYLPGTVVVADSLVVGDRVVSGEDERAARIGRLLARGGDVTAGLRRLGIGYVVTERATPGVGRAARVRGRVAYTGRWLRLTLLTGPSPGPPGPSTVVKTAMLAGDGVAAAALVAAALSVARRAPRRYTRR